MAIMTDKPTVEIPDGPAPADLVVDDLIEGTGATAQPGQQVVVHYVGVSHANGREFDSSWSRNSPFAFGLGAGQVISGWDQGVAGMKVGGRRRITIPPDLAYGKRGMT